MNSSSLLPGAEEWARERVARSHGAAGDPKAHAGARLHRVNSQLDSHLGDSHRSLDPSRTCGSRCCSEQRCCKAVQPATASRAEHPGSRLGI